MSLQEGIKVALAALAALGAASVAAQSLLVASPEAGAPGLKIAASGELQESKPAPVPTVQGRDFIARQVQTRGTFGLFYTLLGQDRFGTVDWR